MWIGLYKRSVLKQMRAACRLGWLHLIFRIGVEGEIQTSFCIVREAATGVCVDGELSRAKSQTPFGDSHLLILTQYSELVPRLGHKMAIISAFAADFYCYFIYLSPIAIQFWRKFVIVPCLHISIVWQTHKS